MFFKEVTDDKTKYSLTKQGISFIKSFIVIISMIALCFSLSYTSVVEARSEVSAPQFTRGSEEIIASKEKAAQKVDSIMTAEDFLGEGERAADFEDIHEYLKELNEKGIINDNKSNEIEDEDISLSDGDAENEDIASENLNENTSKELDEIEEKNDIKDINLDDWKLILVNKQNPVPEDYDLNLSNINGSMQVDSRIVDSVYDMLEAAQKDGVDLMICSAYRSYDRQTVLFNNKMNKLMNKGMSYMEAYAVGSMSVTVPGTSEHQLGLALDILTGSYTAMDDGFGDTKAGKWLNENAPDYGFILRYPSGKEEITGIIYEPWHFRYVGVEYSRDITESGLCLEEYLNGEY